jgi:hypothetical protein
MDSAVRGMKNPWKSLMIIPSADHVAWEMDISSKEYIVRQKTTITGWNCHKAYDRLAWMISQAMVVY